MQYANLKLLLPELMLPNTIKSGPAYAKIMEQLKCSRPQLARHIMPALKSMVLVLNSYQSTIPSDDDYVIAIDTPTWASDSAHFFTPQLENIVNACKQPSHSKSFELI